MELHKAAMTAVSCPPLYFTGGIALGLGRGCLFAINLVPMTRTMIVALARRLLAHCGRHGLREVVPQPAADSLAGGIAVFCNSTDLTPVGVATRSASPQTS